MTQPFQLKHSVLAVGLALAAAPHAGARQEAGEAVPQVLVTGSNLARGAAHAPALLTVLGRGAIEASGASTARQLLDTLTAFDSGTLRDDGSSNSFARGASGASMRGLGKSATLVLLNGRRIASYALADGGKEVFVNLDAIPAAAIEQVEVLRDGVSAVYGSDAMAGVINIVTRGGMRGVEALASEERPQSHRFGGQRTASITGGAGRIKRDGYHVFASLDAYQRDGYLLAETVDAYPPWHKQYVNPGFGEPSLYSFPGNLNEPRAGVRAPVASCPAERISAGGLCTSDLTGITPASDGATRVNVFSQGRWQLGQGLRAFAEAAWSRHRTDYRALPYATVAGAPSTWFNAVQRRSESVPRPRLAVGNPANPFPFPVGIDYRFMDDPGMWEAPLEAGQYRVLAGLTGSSARYGLAWQLAAGRSGSKASARDHGAHRTAFPQAVASGEYRIGGPNSQALLESMFPVIGTDGRTDQRFVDAKLSGVLTQLPGGALQFAIGAEGRREAMRVASSDNVLAGDIIGRGAQLIDGMQRLTAAFLELEAPLSSRLDVNGALRADRVSGFGGHVSPRLGMQYTFSPRLLVRGAAAGGFRAPGIAETQGKVGVAGFYNNTVDPRRCATASAIRDILRTGSSADIADATLAYNAGCASSVPVMVSSRAQLKPETSTSLTLGLVLAPSANVRLALDWFRIERKNEIGAWDASHVLAREQQPQYGALVVRNAVSEGDQRLAARASELQPGAALAFDTGSVQALLLNYENFGRTHSSGIDLDLSGHVQLGARGRLTLGMTSTIALKYMLWDMDANAWRLNLVGLRGAPKYTTVFSTHWQQGPFSAGARVYRTSRTELNFDENDAARWDEAGCQANLRPAAELPCFTGAAMRTDLHLAYGWKRTRVTVNVRNALNTSAPVDLRGGYLLRPRSIKLAVSHKF